MVYCKSLVAVLMLATLCQGQLPSDAAPPNLHNHPVTAPGQETPGVINGAEHPELIPDSTAYRLFFVVVAQSADATPQQKALQQLRLQKASLGTKDLQVVTAVLADFKLRYADMIKQYNDAAEVALVQGQAPDYDGFLLRRNALVEDTRHRLKQELSSDGMANFDQLVVGEKQHMKIKPRSAN